MATGFRVLGYADLDTAHAFIRDCEAEGSEGVSPETYGTRTATGITRCQLPIQERDRGYLTEDEIVDAIDAGVNAEEFEPEEPACASDETDEFEMDLPADDGDDFADELRVAGCRSHAAVVESERSEEIEAPVAKIQDLPVRIGSRRELCRLGIDLFESRMSLRSSRSASWKEATTRRKQFLRHLERLLKEMFPEQ